jgi:hypothetical protein
MWITMWMALGEPGDNTWVTGEERGPLHRHLSVVPVGYTAAVHKEGAVNWENNGFPSFHGPYDYDFLKTER